jgi:hypothetical protein
VNVKMRATAMRQASFSEHPAEIGKFLKARYPGDFTAANQHEHHHSGAVGIGRELLGGRRQLTFRARLAPRSWS